MDFVESVDNLGGGGTDILILSLLIYQHSCCSFTKLYPALCDAMDCSMPGFPVLYYLPEFYQIHVHWVCDAIQLSHPLLSPSPPALNLSQHRSLFLMSWLSPSGSHSTGASASASVHPMNIWGWSPLGLTSWISLQSKGLSRVFSNTTVQKHQFFGPQPSLWSNFHIHTRLLEKPQAWLYRPLSAKWCLCFLKHCLDLS